MSKAKTSPAAFASFVKTTPSPDSSSTAGHPALQMVAGIVTSLDGITDGGFPTLTCAIAGDDDAPQDGIQYNEELDLAVGDKVQLLASGGDYVAAFKLATVLRYPIGYWRVAVHVETATSYTHNAWTLMNFDAADHDDPINPLFDLAANTLTIPPGGSGIWLLEAQWSINAGAQALALSVNTPTFVEVDRFGGTSSGVPFPNAAAGVIFDYFNEGDVLSVYGFNGAATGLNNVVNNDFNEFKATYLGPGRG